MSTREQMEQDVKAAKERLDNLPKGSPQDYVDRLREEYDSLSVELNNMYDDEVNEFTQG